MSTQFTAADIQLVSRALGADYWTDDERAEAARAILAALAEAGRLVPADARYSETWIIQPDGKRMRRSEMTFANGASHSGWWVEADEAGADADRFAEGARQAHDADPDAWHRGMLKPPAPRSLRCAFCGVLWADEDGTP